MPEKTDHATTPQFNEHLRPLGQGIKRAREARSMTLDELAEKSGIDRNMISRYENLRVNPSATALLKIALGLDMNLSELVSVLDHKTEEHAGGENESRHHHGG